MASLSCRSVVSQPRHTAARYRFNFYSDLRKEGGVVFCHFHYRELCAHGGDPVRDESPLREYVGLAASYTGVKPVDLSKRLLA